MTLDELLTPVSEDAPCGADLNETMDPAYDDYYFGALGRLPSFYYRPGVERPDGSRSPDTVFDSNTVNIDAEREAINALLARSRDLRLLVLLAQWEILAGHVPECAAAITAIAGLLETYPDAAHPTLADGPADRRDALGDLNSQVTMVLPLQFLGLTGTDEASLRKIKVAKGELTANASEEDLSLNMLNDALSDPGNAKRIEALHGALVELFTGLARIKKACAANPAAPITTPLDQVTATVREMLDALNDARPELREADAPDPEGSGETAEETAETEDASDAAPLPAIATDGPDVKVAGHPHARVILEACEHYYRQYEPSSAALLLVTQARLLIGRPLTEALQTLLPAEAGRTVIDFGRQTGFSINMDRLQQLSNSAPESSPPEAQSPAAAEPAPAITNAGEAAAAMRSVEDYFRRAERSSPVPLLLQRARGYLDKDFQSLVEELLPTQTSTE